MQFIYIIYITNEVFNSEILGLGSLIVMNTTVIMKQSFQYCGSLVSNSKMYVL